MTQLDDAAFQPPATPRPGTGQFLRGFIGSAVLLVAIDAAEPLFFGEGYFASLTFHPFWIVILLAAVQHGLFVGLSVVGLATMMMDWPSRPVGMDITEHYVDIAIAPAQWLIAALLIGLYRQQQIRHEHALGRENDRLRDINRTLAAEIHRLDAFVARAELAAATRSLPAGTETQDPLAALDRLAGADAEGRAPAFVEAARACLPGSVAWLRLDETGTLTPAAMTDDGAALPGISTAADLPLPLPVVGQALPLARAEGAAPDAHPALCRVVAPGDDPQGVLLAQSPDHDAGLLVPGLNALARALEDSLRRTPDTLPAAPQTRGAVRLGA
ncbi:hypothetical protein GIY56_14450 [Paracoccus sp. YIM 132242]|uniref:DUF4118 domain-containing protein n=1 Tax=Paracoccus lichenicola TaxID=2665644 RepID=A0A6L6HQN0_9RHOB|nr:hypothetical protein [Paracoccus lichenicola]MTE01486.1 hypothetical protein [Paracoccus lichenicola]